MCAHMSVTPAAVWHVGHAGRGLVGGQREGELGVHDRELGAVEVGGQAALEAELVVADDTGVARLGAGGGNREDAGDGGLALGDGRRPLGKEVPDVALVGHAERYCLGGVDGRSAAHGEDDVRPERARGGDALAHVVDARVGSRAPELLVRDPGRVERGEHALERARADHGALAVDDERAGASAGGDLGTDAVRDAAAKDEAGGREEREVVHGGSFHGCTRRA